MIWFPLRTTALILVAGFASSIGLIASVAAEEAPAEKRPGAIWLTGPLEVVFAYPSAFDADFAKDLVGKMIACYDGEIDFIPPRARRLGSLTIAGAKLTDDGRTLTLATDPHPLDAHYLVVTPESVTTYSLSGVETSWFAGEEPGDEPTWKGWQPSLDPVASQRATLGSVPHERWFADLAKTGRLRLETQVRLPAGKGRLTIETSTPMVECFSGDGEPDKGIEKTESGGSRASFAFADASAPLFLSLTVETGGTQTLPSIQARYTTDADDAPHELDRKQLLLPWAPPPAVSAQKAEVVVPDLTGGSPKRGKDVFFSKEALCSQCHVFAGEGGKVGPDLTDSNRKEVEHIYRSIAVPSEEIALEYIPYTVSLKDGRVATGIVRAEGIDAIRVTDTEAKSTKISKDEIEQIRPGATSIMPVGLAPVLGEAKLRDLIEFLRTPPFEPFTGKRIRYVD